ncbi:MAG: sensor histidine kinase [Planctomycetota bacterium]|nr:MAG: sensor histidine kinase [Planctomycetota bacterium]
MKFARQDERIPWFRRLSIRLAFLVVSTLLVSGFAYIPLYFLLGHHMYPAWFDAEFLRWRADALEAVERGELEKAALYDEYEDDSGPFEIAWLFGQVTISAAVLYSGITWMVTRRVQKLAKQAQAPVGPSSTLPGPFQIGGNDELTRLASTMNGLRQRVEVLLQTLARQSEERKQWVAQVSHDIRTPMTALIACLDRWESAKDPNTAGDLVQLARADAGRVRALAEDLLEVARLDAGAELQQEPVLPAELVHQVVAGLRPWLEQGGKRLELELARGLPSLLADGHLLSRALENLLRNGAEHARSLIRLSLRAESEAAEVVLTVDDDGPGFPGLNEPMDLAQLRQEKGSKEGGGLGLAIIDKVVRLHRGSIQAAVSPEGGARVTLRLPVKST